MTDLRSQILSYLKSNPGQKAKVIAKALGVNKKSVNSELFGRLRSSVRQDSSYRWYIKDIEASLEPDSSYPNQKVILKPSAIQRLSTRFEDSDPTSKANQTSPMQGHQNIDPSSIGNSTSSSQENVERARSYTSRNIPWLHVVQFHKEIVTRAEEGFFSLYGNDDQSEQWTSLNDFEPFDMAGSWQIDRSVIRSHQFRMAVEQGQHEAIFLGGPCYLTWKRGMRGNFHPHWRPLLYREVELRPDSEGYEIVPKQATWNINPLLYSRLDSLEVATETSLEDLAFRIIEKAAIYQASERLSPTESILKSTFTMIQDLEGDLTKEIKPGTFKVRPTSWILFAPATKFGVLIRQLMGDFERLEALLLEDPDNIGGLALLEDQPQKSTSRKIDVLQFVPLNASQELAVKKILEEKPMTVISGPPGTGKSQVVVALLLNAWAMGRTILFASNNNKAVDVVRERVERFESEFPIAVRAGARQKQNIQEVLRRTLNLASNSDGSGISSERLRRKRESLLAEKARLQQLLESEDPQRIDEARKTALKAYGEYRTSLAAIEQHSTELRHELEKLGFGDESDSKVEASFTSTSHWIKRIQHSQGLVNQDNHKRNTLTTRLQNHEQERNRILGECGLAVKDSNDLSWLLTGPKPEFLADWDQRIRNILSKPVEHDLITDEWKAEYDEWRSESEALAWIDSANQFNDAVLRICAELAPKIEAIQEIDKAIEEKRKLLSTHGIPEDIQVPIDLLRSWSAAYAEFTTIEPTKLDFLPWSANSKLIRQLKQLEKQLRPLFPLEIWTNIGVLNADGQKQLAGIIEITRKWQELQLEKTSSKSDRTEIESRSRDLRSKAAMLRLTDIPNNLDSDSWLPVVRQCEKKAINANEAAKAWNSRVKKEETEEILRSIAKEWSGIISGLPLHEAWRKGQGSFFDNSIQILASTPNIDAVESARSAIYSGTLAKLIDCWKRACDLEQEMQTVKTEIQNIPPASYRVKEWWNERPKDAFVIKDEPDDWPDTSEAGDKIKAVEAWCVSNRRFKENIKPDLLVKADEELEWATEKLKQAVAVLPPGPERDNLHEIIEGIQSTSNIDWPISDINDAFTEFNPERIQARIERTEAKLEKGSFDDAKAQWLERIRKDDKAIVAVNDLLKSIMQYRGKVVENQFDNFRKALRAVPIWITTAQASQAIPLEPELFDFVVIDEASQCTLTNLLPLMYRGKRLVVIGDENQLPAIPTIQESEELALAKKHDIEDHLSLVGHATNDVYRTAAETLPRRLADVIMLNEHFRSNPQIIGFSNRYIYLQRLELKKKPDPGKLPIGSGVHVKTVHGFAQRGENGRSWMNEPEARAVLELIQHLRQGDSRMLSLGVVTPFRAQKEMLRDWLEDLHLTSEVLVDTAHGFQGDERDIIIFSPVVAKGITASASRWVETPPNMINVALTRAKEALFVVADIDYCLQQEGLLRKMALYCKDIQILRDTSEAELELFSWMVVQGWEPKIHQYIGDVEVDFILNTVSGDRIAIEVDGEKFHADRQEQDKARDVYIQSRGYRVLRFKAREVMETPYEVIHRISKYVFEGSEPDTHD